MTRIPYDYGSRRPAAGPGAIYAKKQHGVAVLLAFLLGCQVTEATTRYVSLVGGHVPPFTDWMTAATNIQAAIDASISGDLIWVTNGFYYVGGKVMAGTLTNRVALDKALKVQSVNGPSVTTILGRNLPSNDGNRCAWLTNGATLSGFSLKYGLSQFSPAIASSQYGGGVWCMSASALVTNCFLYGNHANYGGGAYGGTLKNCHLEGNFAQAQFGGGAGGGAYGSVLNSCELFGNTIIDGLGGATYNCVLTNCTIAFNSSPVFTSASVSDHLYNCIVYFNTTIGGMGPRPNYDFSSTLQYCCSIPLGGTGSITDNPLFIGGTGIHLSASSPCRGRGNASYASGTDIDGQSWSNAPSMGCDEWHVEPAIDAFASIRPGTKVGEVMTSVRVFGQDPMTCYWTKDGVAIEDGSHYGNSHGTNLLVREFGPADAGLYQLMASNSFGVSTSQVFQPSVHCVDAAGTAPTLPYNNWATAAVTIQDGIDAGMPGDVVIVTNGIYASGGRSDDGISASRIIFSSTFPSMLMSINGAEATIIEGQAGSEGTNGTPAMRCVSMAGGGGLSGFTLRNGVTTNSTFSPGGGVYSAGLVAFCFISNNISALFGGGGYAGTYQNCVIVGNSAASYGGGITFGTLNNCLVTKNTAVSGGGGCYSSTLNNCTVTLNSSPLPGTGAFSSTLNNCIVYFNSDLASLSTSTNYGSCTMQSCCALPLPSGAGNISSDPQLVDSSHLSLSSPCRGTGTAAAALGTDLDGQAWATPPSIGCDEVVTSDFAGPLSVTLTSAWPEVAVFRNLPLIGQVAGRASGLQWSFGDGSYATNASYETWHAWSNSGDYTVTFTAFNGDNPGGVSASLLVHVAPMVSPLLNAGGLSNKNFNLQFNGQAGVTYVVERATNLAPPIPWQAVRTLTSTGGLVQVVDPAATNTSRFYRARTQ